MRLGVAEDFAGDGTILADAEELEAARQIRWSAPNRYRHHLEMNRQLTPSGLSIRHRCHFDAQMFDGRIRAGPPHGG